MANYPEVPKIVNDGNLANLPHGDANLVQAPGFAIGESSLTFDRQWTIGNMGDDFGYHAPNGYGGLVPNEWFNFIDTVDILIVDDSANAAILQASDSSMWGISNDVTLQVEGFGDISLTWNGATAYINVGDTAFVTYIMGQVGNSIGLNILPKNQVSPTSKHIITTLLEVEITTLDDDIIHTGS